MLKIKEYVKAESLEEAYKLNQKKSSCVLGGMIWLKMGNRNVGTAIDLSGLGLDEIEETKEEFRIGCMVSLHSLEIHKGLEQYTKSSAYRRRTVPKLCHCRRKYLRQIWFFRCIDDVSGYGFLCGVI